MRKSVIYYTCIGILIGGYLTWSIISGVDRSGGRRTLEDGRNVAEARGYGGTIRIAFELDERNRFRSFELLQNPETPFYASDEDIEEFLSRLMGRSPHNVSDVDGITGATVTVNAIIASLEERRTRSAGKIVSAIMIVVLWCAALALHMLKKRLGKTDFSALITEAISIAGLVVIGVVYNELVGISSLLALPLVFRLLPFLAVCSVLLSSNVYCGRLCPFGTLQRYAGKLPVRGKIRLPSSVRAGRYIVLCLALAALAMGNRLYLEPYVYLFSRKLIWWIYLFPASVLVAAVFVPRIWCRGFCPVGALLTLLQRVRFWMIKGARPRIALPDQSGMTASIIIGTAMFLLILASNILLILLAGA